MAEGTIWADQERARQVVEEAKTLKRWLEPYHALRKRVDEARELNELLESEPNVDLAMQRQLEQEADAIAAQLEALELQNMLQGPDDLRDALLTIHPGAGGTESQDWAEMLMRMYSRWAERHGFVVAVLDLETGEEAGIKRAEIEIRGQYAYGLLKAEIGVHRLVRISPYDAQSRRHTSFASVMVYPEVDDDIEIEIKDDDLRVDVFRASGKGGQHVDAQIVVLDLDLDVVVHLWIYHHRCERGVTAGLRVVRRDPDQPVYSDLRLEQAVGVLAANLDLGPLDPRLLARFQVEHRNDEPVPLRPARVHPHQHLRPVLRLRASRPGMDREQRIAQVVGALEHVLELERLELGGDGVGLLLQLPLHREVYVGLRLEQLVELARLVDALAERVVWLEPALERLGLLDHLASPLLVRPDGPFRHGVLHLAQPLALPRYVKGSSAARRDGGPGPPSVPIAPRSFPQKILLPPARISFRASLQNGVPLAMPAPICSTYSCQLFSISSLKSCGRVPSRSPCWRFSG